MAAAAIKQYGKIGNFSITNLGQRPEICGEAYMSMLTRLILLIVLSVILAWNNRVFSAAAPLAAGSVPPAALMHQE